MTSPRVSKMVLFKHGVAYVERGGPSKGSFELSFEKDEMKDVLKSLAVWVVAGDARPSAIAFDKPDDPLAMLEERGLALPDDATLTALVTALRGRRVRIHGAGAVEGEIVGLDRRPAGEDGLEDRVVLRIEGGMLRVIPLAQVERLELVDAAAVADVDLLLDRRRAATSSARRTVRVNVDGEAADLRVAYVVPAPVWRVSYRVVSDGPKTVLAAWAIVHNPLDEDVEDVALTLTTGQPISFDIDLYRPKHVERVVVEESSRAAAAPTQYERAYAKGAPMPAAAAAMAPPGFGVPTGAAGIAGGPPPPPAAPMVRAFEASAAGAAALADRGELFEFRIARPITLPRGGSALAPLIAAGLEARKERIWRVGMPPAPDLVLAFANESGAVLEEGPAVVYDEGVYAGEAMVPYAVRGAKVKLAYAKDLAVRCRHELSTRHVRSGLRLADRFVSEEHRVEDRHVVRVESDHDVPVEIVIELARRGDRAIDTVEGAARDEDTASFHRVRATVAPRSKHEIAIVAIGHGARHLEYAALTPAQLDQWLREGVLEGGLRGALQTIVQLWSEAASHDRRAQALEVDRNHVLGGQSAITQQLSVLKDAGPEGELRLRYVRELAQSQDRVLAIDRELVAAREAAADARRRAELALAQALGRAPG